MGLESDLVHLSAGRVVEVLGEILCAHGTPRDRARLVAQHLVASTVAGHDSHGVIKIFAYVRLLIEGAIQPSSSNEVLAAGPGFVVINGHRGFGQVAMADLRIELVKRARETGVASGILLNVYDLGRLGAYVSDIADQQMIALMMIGGGTPLMAPWGGVEKVIGTSPIAFASPVRDAPAICIDMSTSVAAGGKVILAGILGKQVPAGWIQDGRGRPSTDPSILLNDGSMLPLGAPLAGHKGFALSLMIQILGGVLCGVDFSGRESHPGQGVFLHVLDIAHFIDVDAYLDGTEALIQRIAASRQSEDADGIRIPGARGAEFNSQTLVAIDSRIWTDILTLASPVDVAES